MDLGYVKSIIEILKASDLSDFNFLRTTIRPVRYEEPFLEDGSQNPEYDSQNPFLHTVGMSFSEVAFSSRQFLSKSWIANNILIFTVFDGWIEEHYGLGEGDSFLRHYKDLKSVANTDLDFIALNCYRLMKTIRNGIQHNLSSVEFDDNGFHIAYVNRNGTDFLLEITKNGVNILYTIILGLIEGRISEIERRFSTVGHYEGILRYYHKQLVDSVRILEDDIRDSSGNIALLKQLQPDGLMLYPYVRYPIENPRIVEDGAEDISFVWYDAGCSEYGVD